ncbi:MAG: hypothetical protein QM715_04110 [Nibricoccus sp.]
MSKDHEQQRKELWCEVYAAAIKSSDSADPQEAEKRADTALSLFDQRFSPPTIVENDGLDSVALM